MTSHHDRHYHRCSTDPSKRTDREQVQSCSEEQTVKILKFSSRDAFPFIKVFEAPIRLAHKMAQTVNPFPIRFEKHVVAPPYERGWSYIERRNGQLCLVRNRKDVFRLHRPSKKRAAPPRDRDRDPEREVIIVREEDMDVIGRHHRVHPHGDRLFVEVCQERREPGDPSPRPRPPRIEVRRPLNATPPCSPVFEETPHHRRESFPFRLVQKIPVERARLRCVRHARAPEDPLHCSSPGPPPPQVVDDCYEDEVFFDPMSDLNAREPRPYHIPEPENAVWDEDMNAWVVRRSPKVRFC
ncbi:hypothetical protein Z517_02684 [Fonsecaea pedrosoi CBS 271.37]|uniref:Uncharacterized protein n=1 Tax=Fonsecaea pedrosoi CBS 271.37 TaxID=1442368 RepID=A0A0D2HG87_9EURO|nr:uncharacterized protein Z517_02684 [Fonsecaea pedrosoi CBS 271.37]KIW83439.1 hypothetical protein Z517_02684 [Fonsecaea pedrosoi CBS 271.37]